LAPLASRRLAINLAPLRHVSRKWRAHDSTSGLWLGYALRDIEIGVSLSADSRGIFLSSSNVLTLRGRPRNIGKMKRGKMED
jgi:hypothetical protein